MTSVAPSPFNLLDLFSGIGGFSLGLERTGGFKTVGFCEIEPACRRVLAKHWPDVPCAPDIRTRIFQEGEADVITGGFPCQDISNAGSRAELAGARSGLWREMLRAIRVVRPLYAIVENVAALRRRGLGTVLGDLAEIGADAEWHCIPGASVGSPDIRDRLWLIAKPQHPYTDRLGPHQAEVYEPGSPELRDQQDRFARPLVSSLSDALARLGSASRRGWNPEPGICRVADRTTAAVDRVKQLGNAVKPKIPELIGRAILGALRSSDPVMSAEGRRAHQDGAAA
jgi:DNA (cytosine-5)-methyltransferase 1